MFITDCVERGKLSDHQKRNPIFNFLSPFEVLGMWDKHKCRRGVVRAAMRRGWAGSEVHRDEEGADAVGLDCAHHGRLGRPWGRRARLEEMLQNPDGGRISGRISFK